MSINRERLSPERREIQDEIFVLAHNRTTLSDILD